jgi:hypothetical protein
MGTGGTTTFATISGGASNIVGSTNPATTSVIAGGSSNRSEAIRGTVSGGSNNLILDQSDDSTIGGGLGNSVSGPATATVGNVISGGGSNSITEGRYCVIGGGESNLITETIGPGSIHATIGGGDRNEIGNSGGGASCRNATIGGGIVNFIGRLTGPAVSGIGQGSTIGGGNGNEIVGQQSTIGGGNNNMIRESDGCTICGGETNVITDTGTNPGMTICGGNGNTITDSNHSIILGGDSNSIASNGGLCLAAGDAAAVAATHDHAMIFSCVVGGGTTPAANTYTVDFGAGAVGGAGVYMRTLPLTPGGILGMEYDLGTGQLFRDASSQRYKDNIVNLPDQKNVIDELRPVQFTWKQSGIPDTGFIAEDVNEIIPTTVPKDEEGRPEGLRWQGIVAVLVQEVQKLRQRVAQLESHQ